MTTVEAGAERVAEGAPLGSGGKIDCHTTGATLREGDIVTVRFARSPENGWRAEEVFHPAAAEYGLREPSETGEFYVKGRLAVRADCATQESFLVVADPRLIDRAESV